MSTPEFKAAVSAGLARRWKDEAEHVKSSKAQIRRYKLMTPQEKAALCDNMSAAQMRRWCSAAAEQREEWTKAVREGQQTPQARANCSKSSKLRWRTMPIEDRLAFVEAINAGKRTPQARANFSKGTKLVWQNKTPAQRAAWTAAHIAGNRTPKARAKSAESTRAFWATMTPVERSAHYQATHPNGNGRNKI
jgi:hypothetical protein